MDTSSNIQSEILFKIEPYTLESRGWYRMVGEFGKIVQIQIQIQNSLLLPIYIVMIIHDDMDTMYTNFSSTISYTLCR